MVAVKQKDKIIVSSALDFDIEKTLTCGQIFRFYKEDSGYRVFSLDKTCFLFYEHEKVIIETSDINYFYNFFDLDTDYEKIYFKARQFPELTAAADNSRGIRILNQDLFEVIVGFIISQNNNIKRIQSIIERLCKNFGAEFGDKDNKFYAFPTKQAFTKITQKDFFDIGAGFRDKYLYGASNLITNESWLNDLINLSTSGNHKKAQETLKSIKGIGDKVANCIMLFGLNITLGFPVDTWIFNACKSETLNTKEKIEQYYKNRYGEIAGICQQYIFYNSRNLKN